MFDTVTMALDWLGVHAISGFIFDRPGLRVLANTKAERRKLGIPAVESARPSGIGS
jgi:hypothetical protein